MFRPMKITFRLDGTGIHYDPMEPIMLDGLLASALCRWHVHGEPPARDEKPFDVPLPLARWRIGDAWGWRASALFPDGPTGESLQYWRQRCRQSRIERTTGAPNLTNGTYRDWNTPLPLLLCTRMVAYAVGEIAKVRRELNRNVKRLGKKRAHGRGEVVAIAVEPIDEDRSLCGDNSAMRWIPRADGTRLVRPRPPYWNALGRVACCEIGDPAEDLR